jgi:Ca2+-binding EF-hand superfamily protein
MYSNLSRRCRNNQLSRETFDMFFHSSGLIGEIIFIKFDSSKKGVITFEQFLQAFEVMIKGTIREKADVLFDIYDLERSGGVNFSELLKIVSVPRLSCSATRWKN